MTKGQRPAFADWLGDTNDVTRMFLAAGQIPGMINIAGGLPEPEIYPSEEMSRLAQQAFERHAMDILNYPPVNGIVQLREKIAEMHSSENVRLTAENVLITSGGLQGLELIGKAMLNEGETVATQSPAYLGAFDTWRPRRPQYRGFFPDRNDFDPSTAFAGAKFAYTVPNFSNPTGKLIDRNCRERMLDAAIETGTWLVEDDPYSILYYDFSPLPSILEMAMARQEGFYDGPVIYLGSLSKQLAPGLRIGWVIAAPEMIDALSLTKQGTDMCTSGISQMVAYEALEEGLPGKIRDTIVATYRQRRDALCAALDEYLSPWFEWEVPVGGMFVWASAKDADFDTDALLEHAMEHKVCISPGSVFDPEGQDHRSMRLNFTRNSPDDLEEAARRLAEATKSYLAT